MNYLITHPPVLFISAAVFLVLAAIHKIHIHIFSKPIASQYVSFNQRNIIYECRCGKRKMQKVYRAFDEPFPIITRSLTDAEMQKILNR